MTTTTQVPVEIVDKAPTVSDETLVLRFFGRQPGQSLDGQIAELNALSALEIAELAEQLR